MTEELDSIFALPTQLFVGVHAMDHQHVRAQRRHDFHRSRHAVLQGLSLLAPPKPATGTPDPVAASRERYTTETNGVEGPFAVAPAVAIANVSGSQWDDNLGAWVYFVYRNL